MDKSKWEYKKLGDVATFLNGYAFKPDNWSEHGLKIIRIQNLTDENALYNCYNGDIDPKYIVHKGDLLISWSATLGAFIWNNDDALLNQHIFKTIFDKSDIDKFYLRYCVISKLEEFSKKAHGITMRHITKKDFDNTIIPVPCIVDQQRIVAELDCLNEMIALKQEQLKEFDKLARSIFHDMFGDKDFPKYQLKDVLSKIGSGATPSGGNQSYKTEGISLIRSLNVHNNEFVYKDLAFIDEQQAKQLNNVTIEENDVLLNITGASVARCCIVPSDVLPARVNQHVSILRPRNELLDCLYLCHYLISCEEQAKLLSLSKSKAATREALPKNLLEKYMIKLPPLALQQQFAEKIQAIEAQKELVKQSIAETQQLLDSRMDYYFD